MKKTFSVYVSPLEMDSSLGRLTDLPIEQEKLNGLLLEMNTGQPLYVEVSDYCGRDYLAEHLPEDMKLTELNLLAFKLADLTPWQNASFEGLVHMDLDKGMEELPLNRLIDLANSVDCCHVVAEAGNDEQLGHFYVDNERTAGLWGHRPQGQDGRGRRLYLRGIRGAAQRSGCELFPKSRRSEHGGGTMRDSLFDALDGMEMGKSEHDWLEQRFGSMTAKERLLFHGAMQLEHPQIVKETLRLLNGLEHYRLLYGADEDVSLGRFVMEHIQAPAPIWTRRWWGPPTVRRGPDVFWRATMWSASAQAARSLSWNRMQCCPQPATMPSALSWPVGIIWRASGWASLTRENTWTLPTRMSCFWGWTP